MAEQLEKKYTNEMLKEMQSWDLDRKIATTLTRIAEFANHFNNQVYVSFSGGKDSTVLLDLVRKVVPDVPVVFSNTGLEYPEIQSFARSKGAEFVRPKMMFNEVITKYGYPIISKEVSEAIYYARRIIKPPAEKSPKKNRLELLGKRPMGSVKDYEISAERERERELSCSSLNVVRQTSERKQRSSQQKIRVNGKTPIRKQKELLGVRQDNDGYG